ncbi:MAG: penicillin-binding protein 2, partial [Anaerolineales bacterium]|nr:penicillin-binding protein 2 [Anaerolineales bacterium]
RPQVELLALLTANQTYVNISDGRVSEEVANLIRDLDFQGIQIDPVSRRIYPQGKLLCHVIGYTNFDGVGSAGLEGHYQRELAGEAASAVVSYNPLTEQPSVISREGSDLILTIDRSVQFLVEEHLSNAIRQHGAEGGTIIVMDPRTGAILAMASTPCYNPYNFYEEDERYFLNPAISQQFEPGSVMKLITMAAAIDSGTVTPNSTYYDSGTLEVGGQYIYNWDRSGGGTTDMTTLLARSLNIGAATLALWMGTDTYYDYMTRFGFGTPTGVDVMAEAIGQVPQPGDELWTETNLAVNAFGQGMA